jgi:D-amino-acid dehydrogenase
VKGYSVTLDALRWPSPPRVPVVDDTLHAAVTPLGSRIRVAGTAEFAGYDSRVRAARIDNLFGLLARLYPSSLQHLDRTQAAPWAGLRPMSADGVPIIGPCRIGNLFLNTGHGHLGWSMSVGSARALADHMLNRIPRFDLSAYNISRFD